LHANENGRRLPVGRFVKVPGRAAPGPNAAS
jgi:hypothetical protein